MREIGLAATELGPEGFLPAALEAVADVLSRHQLHAMGGFTSLLLHRPDDDPAEADQQQGMSASTFAGSAESRRPLSPRTPVRPPSCSSGSPIISGLHAVKST
jgi:hypothetical protein